MPTYDYTCSSCGDFEYFQKITDEPLASCPQCGGEVKRLISKNTNIIFKGSGFYITDHRKQEYVSKAKQETGKKESASSSASSSASADASASASTGVSESASSKKTDSKAS